MYVYSYFSFTKVLRQVLICLRLKAPIENANLKLKHYLVQRLDPDLYGSLGQRQREELRAMVRTSPRSADGFGFVTGDHQIDCLLGVYSVRHADEMAAATTPTSLAVQQLSLQQSTLAPVQQRVRPPQNRNSRTDADSSPAAASKRSSSSGLASRTSSFFLPRMNSAGNIAILVHLFHSISYGKYSYWITVSRLQEVENDSVSSLSGEEAAPSLRNVDQGVQLPSTSVFPNSHQQRAQPAQAQRPSFLSTLQPRLGYVVTPLYLLCFVYL